MPRVTRDGNNVKLSVRPTPGFDTPLATHKVLPQAGPPIEGTARDDAGKIPHVMQTVERAIEDLAKYGHTSIHAASGRTYQHRAKFEGKHKRFVYETPLSIARTLDLSTARGRRELERLIIAVRIPDNAWGGDHINLQSTGPNVADATIVARLTHHKRAAERAYGAAYAVPRGKWIGPEIRDVARNVKIDDPARTAPNVTMRNVASRNVDAKPTQRAYDGAYGPEVRVTNRNRQRDIAEHNRPATED